MSGASAAGISVSYLARQDRDTFDVDLVGKALLDYMTSSIYE